MNFEKAEKLAQEAGFDSVAYLDCETIELLEEVRGMCAMNTCGMYGKNQACPPSCGTLEECRKRIGQFHWGILIQTVGEIEDSFDFEGMQQAEKLHKKQFLALADKLRSFCPDLLPLGSGCCTVCKSCVGPDAPCRFPQKRMSSLEAYGILVSDLCSKNHLKYHYGPEHIAYTALFLLG
ncbi:MAG: DUF2284 domain-containing protein [Lachnospiraceae bacterium]|nr:DUF2284 domain-containing protein [Lachnospiraceae bacterium]